MVDIRNNGGGTVWIVAPRTVHCLSSISEHCYTSCPDYMFVKSLPERIHNIIYINVTSLVGDTRSSCFYTYYMTWLWYRNRLWGNFQTNQYIFNMKKLKSVVLGAVNDFFSVWSPSYGDQWNNGLIIHSTRDKIFSVFVKH